MQRLKKYCKQNDFKLKLTPIMRMIQYHIVQHSSVLRKRLVKLPLQIRQL